MYILKKLIFLLLLPAVFISCATSSSSPVAGRTAPEWVFDVDSVFPRSRYVAATGFASDRAGAEANALASAVAFFGQTVQVDRTSASAYRQAIVNGVVDSWTDTAEMRASIRTTSEMENLMGLEIKEVWYDSRGTYYAAAVIEKQRAAHIYNESIRANVNVIDNLLAMTPDEKNTINGVIRYRFAAAAADINVYYKNIVLLLDGTVPYDVVSGDYYRLEAQNIIKLIPISIRVANDRNGRIFGAFAKCFTDWGFNAAPGPARYVLNADIALSPVDLPNNPNVFSRVETAASLADTRNGVILLPYNYAGREGHVTRTEADNRAIAALERDINEKFAGILSDYLSSLLPKN